MRKLRKLFINFIICCFLLGVCQVAVVEMQPAVVVQAATVKINKTKLTLKPKQSYQLKISGTKQKVTWTSSNSKIVSVTSKGKVTAKKSGTAKIRATVSGKKFYCTVTVKKPKEETPAPRFPWEKHPVIAHALGAVDGKVYLNSKESFIENYNKGCRLFEVDLQKTSDGVWVCRHDWNESMGQWEHYSGKLSLKEFLSRPIYGTYTPMSLQDLFVLLKKYPDAYVLLDTKQYSFKNYYVTLKDYGDYIKIAEKAGAKETLKQIIPQVYNQSMHEALVELKVFQTYLYSLWTDYSADEITRIADFCKEKKIQALTISTTNWTPEIQQILDKRGIYVYLYTVNNIDEARKYLQQGAAGICTDTIVKNELPGR